ncbi:MAG: GtrA family protein [Lachnospiraceae bacterium]|nr:GtrA family protein [Lachnospiraceae bacterium]
MKERLWQIIKFIMVGISNTLISEGIYALLVLLGVHYLLASTIGFTVSIFTAFLLSSRFVFKEDQNKEKRVWWKVLIKTYLAYIVGFLLNLGLLSVWMEVIHLDAHINPLIDVLHTMGWKKAEPYAVAELIAEGINLFIVTPINFTLNKYWAYRQKSKEAE